MEQYTGLFHLALTAIGIIGYQLYKVYNEKALIRSIFLCIDNGEV